MTRALALVERLDTLLLYAFALGASLLGIWIVIPVLRPTVFIHTSVRAIVIGFALSYLLSRPIFAHRWLALLIGGAAGGVALWQWVSAFIGDYVRGGLLWITVDETVMVVMIGVMVARSYTLFTRNALLFSVLPPLAIYGLMASNLIGRQLVLGFLGVLFAGVQLAGLEHYVSRREAAGGRGGRGLAGHLLVVSLMFGLLAMVGAGVTTGIRFLGSRYRPPLDTMTSDPYPGIVSRVRGSFLNWLYRFEVGTGPAQLNPAVVLRLRSPEPLYLRARVYDQFGGSSWTVSGHDVEAGRPFSDVARRAAPAPGARTVRYGITLEQDSPLVFHASQVVALSDWTLPDGSRPPEVSADVTGGLQARPPLVKGTGYQAESIIRDLNLAERHAGPVRPDRSVPGALGYPGTSRPAIDLARRLTEDTRSLEEKVRILAGWVSNHADYSTEADSYPVGADVTAHFMEHGGEAYCDVFATVFAVMARGVGIPTVLVTGYRADILDPQEGVYMVRGTDAHAWTEVYLPGQGWVIVDPTPAPSVWVPIPSWWQRVFGGELAARNLGLVVGLLALGALSILVAVRSGWLRLPGAGPRVRVPAGPRGMILRNYQQACRLLGRLGIARQAAQTPAEYLSAVAGLAVGLGVEAAVPALGSLTDRFQRVRYGPHGVTLEEVEAAGGEVDRLRQALRRRRKKARRQNEPSSENKSC